MKFQPLQSVTILKEIENTINISEDADFAVSDKRIAVETEVTEIANLGVLEESCGMKWMVAT